MLCTLLSKQILNAKDGWARAGDGMEVQEAGDICIHRADSRCRTEETIILIHHVNLWLSYVQAFI